MGKLILIERLKVQNANAISSSLTIGVPSITAFMGFAHQLQRLVSQSMPVTDFNVTGVGVIVHDVDLQARQFIGSRTLLKLTANARGSRDESKKSERASFIEEGRCHLEVSLLLDCETDYAGGQDRLLQALQRLVFGRMRLAGGEIINTKQVAVKDVPDDRRTLCRLIPGWVLIERRKLMRELMQSAVAEGRDALDAMHDALAIRHQRHVEAETVESSDSESSSKSSIRWTSSRLQPGFVVPIATGYQALSPIMPSNNARDRQTRHRLAESVLTLGEFVLPIRLDRPSESLWRYHVEGDLYTCRQNNAEDSIVPSPAPGDI